MSVAQYGGLAADAEAGRLYAANGNEVLVLDIVTGAVVDWFTPFPSYIQNIDGMEFYDGSLLIGDALGVTYHYDLETRGLQFLGRWIYGLTGLAGSVNHTTVTTPLMQEFAFSGSGWYNADPMGSWLV